MVTSVPEEAQDIPSVRVADGAEVNAELLALLVEMAALEAERTRHIGHVMMVALELGEQHLPLERLDAFGERAAGRAGGGATGRLSGGLGQRQADRGSVHFVATRKQQQPLDDVAQLTHVAGPGVAL